MARRYKVGDRVRSRRLPRRTGTIRAVIYVDLAGERASEVAWDGGGVQLVCHSDLQRVRK